MKPHEQAWEDWASLDPFYAILTDPKFRHGGGDRAEFFETGQSMASGVLLQCDELGLAQGHGRALDFGCGVGRISAPLSQTFGEVIGLDVSPSMVAEARKVHASVTNCRFEVHQGNTLGHYQDQSFDLVFCVLVLQHLSSQAAILEYLQEFVRVLRPGGALAFQLPSSVPAPLPLPHWRTRTGLKARLAPILRRLGVSAKSLQDRWDWAPQMTMTAVPEDLTLKTLSDAGASVVFATPVDVDRGGTSSRIYFATR